MNYFRVDAMSNVASVSFDKDYISSEGIKRSFKHLFELFKKFVDENISKFTTKEDKTLDLLIIDAKESFNDLEFLLSQDNFYIKELYVFRSIRRISFYIFDNEEILFDNILLIRNMVDIFYNVLNLKSILSIEDYEIEYHNFLLKLSNYEGIFYTEVLDASEEQINASKTVVSSFFKGDSL